MRNIIKSILLLILIINLYACSSKQAQTKKYFRIESNAIITSATTKPITLVVKRPTALSILGGRPMVATQDDQSLVQLSNHFWLESPKVLLHDIIKNWAKLQWQTVSVQTPYQTDHHILTTRILAFEKNQNLSNVALEFSLYDAENALLFNKSYSHSETIDGEGYKAFSKAISRSVDAILNQLSDEL